jgi:hypothetical protein
MEHATIRARRDLTRSAAAMTILATTPSAAIAAQEDGARYRGIPALQRAISLKA